MIINMIIHWSLSLALHTLPGIICPFYHLCPIRESLLNHVHLPLSWPHIRSPPLYTRLPIYALSSYHLIIKVVRRSPSSVNRKVQHAFSCTPSMSFTIGRWRNSIFRPISFVHPSERLFHLMIPITQRNDNPFDDSNKV